MFLFTLCNSGRQSLNVKAVLSNNICGEFQHVHKEDFMSRVRIIIALLALLLSLQAAVYAQTSGSVRGEINDPEGKPLPGVAVVISGPALIGGPRTAYRS